MKKVIRRLLVVVGAVAMAVGFAMPAQAQSVTICYDLFVSLPNSPIAAADCLVLPPPA